MKKIICLLLSVLIVCSFGLAAVAQAPIQATFSFNKVSGKAEDIVYVNFSLLQEGTQIGAMEVDFGFDITKVELIQNPQSGVFFTPGAVLESFVEGTNFVFSKELLRLGIATTDGVRNGGVIGTFALRLLQDLPDEQAVVACRFRFTPVHCQHDNIQYEVKLKNIWNGYEFPSMDPNAMVDNKVEFTLGTGSGEKGDHIAIPFGIRQSDSYIKEFSIQLTFDETLLRLSDENTSNMVFVPSKPAKGLISFDEETNILRFSAEEGLTQNITFGYFSFEIIGNVTQPVVVTPVTFEFVQKPVHSKNQEFVYTLLMVQGGVTVFPPAFLFEENETGLTLVKYQGRNIVERIPFEVDGKAVTAIGANAFVNCNKLASLTVPGTVTHIEENAFAGMFVQYLVLEVDESSAAKVFAEQKGIQYKIVSDMVPLVTDTDVLTPGDLNGDQNVDAKDALWTLKYAVKKVRLLDLQIVAADVNKDDIINARDALEMLKKSVGKSACF